MKKKYYRLENNLSGGKFMSTRLKSQCNFSEGPFGVDDVITSTISISFGLNIITSGFNTGK